MSNFLIKAKPKELIVLRTDCRLFMKLYLKPRKCEKEGMGGNQMSANRGSDSSIVGKASTQELISMARQINNQNLRPQAKFANMLGTICQ